MWFLSGPVSGARRRCGGGVRRFFADLLNFSALEMLLHQLAGFRVVTGADSALVEPERPGSGC